VIFRLLRAFSGFDALCVFRSVYTIADQGFAAQAEE
jgi:hypothetical protein